MRLEYLSAAGRGFETPTINELSYRADGQSGMNFGLKPSTNDTIEIGSKTRIGDAESSALFQTDTDDEIVVDSSSGGRTTYKNAGKTCCQGAELAWDQRFAVFSCKRVRHLADATYRSNVCNEQDCNGNRMPLLPGNMGFASIGYVPEDGWYAGTKRVIWAILWQMMKIRPKRRLILSSAYSPGINTITTI